MIFVVCACYEVEVKLISDDNVVEDFIYHWEEEKPPFRQNVWEFDMDFYKTDRWERQAPVSNRKDPNCVDQLAKMREATKNKPVQLALAKETGEQVTMSCHYCVDSESETYGSANWFKLGHQGTSEIYTVKEVEIDMHDYGNENRVTMSVDHTLVIEALREEDVGSYFCRTGSMEQDRYVKERMSTADVSALLGATDRFRFIYHVDILMPSTEPVVGVSRTEDGYAKPAQDMQLEERNMLISTQWQNWGPCSVCDEPGERKRHGLCVITKLDQSKHTRPWHVDAILSSYYGGVPCRSRLFVSNPGIKTRPDEVEVEACNVTCQNPSVKKGKAMSSNGLGQLSFGEKAAIKITNDMKRQIEIGSQFETACPGATVDTSVNWVIDSNYYSSYKLRNASKGRIEVNVFGKLLIHTADVNDTGSYACWYGGQKRLTLDLLVLPPPDDEAGIYFTYLLLSQLANFSVFLLCMIVRHKHRQVQVRNVQRKRSSKHLDLHGITSQGDGHASGLNPAGANNSTILLDQHYSESET